MRSLAACNWKIKRSALPDSFFWSVQSIDSAFRGSAFSPVQHLSFLPRIQLVTPDQIQYGEIPVDGNSEWTTIVIRNTSLADLELESVHFLEPTSQFELYCPNIGFPLLPGSSDSLYVRFAPYTLGAVCDTLYIESDAVNDPVLKIRLTGTGIQVPPNPPDNVAIAMDGYNAVISWDPVTQTIFGTPFTPDYYLVFYNRLSDPYGPYYYLGRSWGLSFTHDGVGLHAEHMFYRVVAYKYYGREEPPIIALEAGMSEDEVKRILQQIE